MHGTHQTKRFFLKCLLFLWLPLAFACQEERKGYTLKERILISRMVQDSVVVRYPEIDSICEEEFPEKVNQLVDSLLPIRLRKMIMERERELRKREGDGK